MATRNNTRPSPVEWEAILGRFSDGIAIISVTRRALAHREIAHDEQVSLAAGITALSAVYEEIDVVVERVAS